jgi:hypothetical protein
VAGDTNGLAAIARILAHPEVTGVQVLRERPACVGVRKGSPPEHKWTWTFGPNAAVALAMAEKALAGLPLLAEEVLP